MNINIKEYLTKRNIIGLIIIAILVIAIPLSVYLIRQQQILKSKAAAAPVTFSGDGVTQSSEGFVTTEKHVLIDLRAPDPNGSDW